MRIKKGFVLREVSGRQVVMGEGLSAIDFGRLLCLNDEAAWLWNEAQKMGDFTVDALARRLFEEYEVTEEVAHQDVAEIVEGWQQMKMLA